MSTEAPFVCDHEGCQAAVGGPCALGHTSPADCPEAAATLARQTADAPARPEAPAPADEEIEVPAPPEGAPLAPGVSLTVEEASALAGHHGARLVLPAGFTAAGKTTFIVELYAGFLGGEKHGAAFYESQTLLDLELLSFPSRLRDPGQLPKTWRTRIEDSVRALLHLAVKPTGRAPVHLLLGNYSGELYERISDHGEALAEVPLLGQCERLLVFLDGELLAKPGTRSAALSRTRQLLRVINEEGALGPGAQVALVVAKLDYLEAAGDEQMESWTVEEEDLRTRLEELGRPTKVFRIAARPRGGWGAGDESQQLFEWLLEPDPASAPTPPPPDPAERAFERFGEAR